MPAVLHRITAVFSAALLWSVLPPLPVGGAETVQRTFGADRVTTAVQASQDFRASATDALLTTADGYPDALAAAPLANALDAPLLLTDPDALSGAVADELARLGVGTVWLLGGTGAVSETVETQLRELGYTVQRLAGDGRYGTGRAIAETAGPSATGEVVVALGEHDDPDRAWPDAIAAGALAATPDQVPIVLTRPDGLPADSVAALEALQATKVLLLGGEQSISPAVAVQLAELGYAVERIAGRDRYDTSLALAALALPRFGAEAQTAVFASGENFPDALSAGAVAANIGAPLLLVPPTSLPPSTQEFLLANAQLLTAGILVGGPAAAADTVVAQLDAVLQGRQPARVTAEAGVEVGPDGAEAQVEASVKEEEAPAEDAETVLDVFEGDASWYGPGFAGSPTASGEIFDPSALTAAHRTLPFDTRVRVTNLANDLVVIVRINDRGPFNYTRVIDLSSAAADALAMKGDGEVRVRVEVLADEAA